MPFEVVPGITAGIAAPAYAGIPVTQRGLASARRVRHRPRGSGEARYADRLAGARGVPRDARLLHGRAPAPADCRAADRRPGARAAQPAAVVERGTLDGQRSVSGPLSEIAAIAAAAEIRAPAITVVGDVAGLAGPLSWLDEARPLNGGSVAVTRARAQASGLAARLRALGAEVVEAPAIRIEPLEADVPDLPGYDLLCITSPNGAEQLLERVRDARALAGPRIAVIGPGTARALREHGIEADLVPERSVAEALVEALAGVPVTRALIARAEDARDVLPDALRERGAEVDVLALYRTVAEPLGESARSAALGSDYATFTSASSARFFAQAAGTLDGPRIASIGPVTSEALRALGREPDIEAADHTPGGLVEALLADVARRRAD